MNSSTPQPAPPAVPHLPRAQKSTAWSTCYTSQSKYSLRIPACSRRRILAGRREHLSPPGHLHPGSDLASGSIPDAHMQFVIFLQTTNLQPAAWRNAKLMCRHVLAATKPPFAALWLQPYWLRSHRILSVKGPSQSHQATGLGVRKLFVIPELKASCSRDSCILKSITEERMNVWLEATGDKLQ